MAKKDSILHMLIPKHTKVSEKELNELYKKYNISFKDIPKISKNDPALRNMDIKEGDVIKILRKSPTAGETIFYRGVTNV